MQQMGNTAQICLAAVQLGGEAQGAKVGRGVHCNAPPASMPQLRAWLPSRNPCAWALTFIRWPTASLLHLPCGSPG